jgi:hypothetical protein
MDKKYFMKSMIVLGLMFAILLVNTNYLPKAKAETGVGKDVFKVIVTLYGITNSTKDITTIVNVKDQTKIKLFNPENPENQVADKVSYTMTFPDLRVDDGDSYTVCTVSVNDFKLHCIDGKNSPLNRPEFVDINVGGGSNKANEKGD